MAFVRVVVPIRSNHDENVQDRELLYCPYKKCKTTITDMVASLIWTIVLVVLGIIVLIILLRVLFGLI